MFAARHGPLASFRLARLVRRAADGDGRAFRALFRALHPTVYGYLAVRLSIAADAEDLTAQVFTRVVERLQSYEHDRGSPRAWALAIARNLLIDHLRARREHAPLEEVESTLADAPMVADAAVDDPRLERVRAALQRHPPRVREMFALRFTEGLRYKEIAVVLEMSEAAVKQRFSRVLRELRRRAAKGGPKEEVGYAH